MNVHKRPIHKKILKDVKKCSSFINFFFTVGKIARGPDALSVLENESVRSLFYADLLEVCIIFFMNP